MVPSMYTTPVWATQELIDDLISKRAEAIIVNHLMCTPPGEEVLEWEGAVHLEAVSGEQWRFLLMGDIEHAYCGAKFYTANMEKSIEYEVPQFKAAHFLVSIDHLAYVSFPHDIDDREQILCVQCEAAAAYQDKIGMALLKWLHTRGNPNG